MKRLSMYQKYMKCRQNKEVYMEDINKDIEILENLLEEGFEAMCYSETQAIDHLIKAYKELEEEKKNS